VHGVQIVLAVVVLATLVATVAERLRAPAPALLVLCGVVVGLIPAVPDVEVGPEIVAVIVLPPLIYAGAAAVAIQDLRRVAVPVAALAVGLVAVTASAVAVTLHALAPTVPLRLGFVLGAVLASTDPVAVTALARLLQLPPRLLALLQGESLLNDATSLVLFRIALGAVAATGVSPSHAAGQLLSLAGGGAAVGVLGAGVAGWLRRSTVDPVLTVVVALVTPYAVYVGAESLEFSGVTAVVVAGLGLRRRDPHAGSPASRMAVATVYDVVVFVLESGVFALIGLQLPTLVRRLPAGEPSPWGLVVVIAAVLLAVRLLWVGPTARGAAGFRVPRTQESATASWRLAAVATWAGTRGVVPLAAALSIPISVQGVAFPHRGLLLVVASGVIVSTLVLQGLSLAPLVNRLRVGDDPTRLAEEESRARHAAALAGRARLEQLLDAEAAPVVVAERLRRHVDDRVLRAAGALEQETADDGERGSTGEAYQRLRRDLLGAEAEALLRLRDEGVLGEAVRRRLQAALDAESTGLR